MENFTISLRKWISISSCYEAMSILRNKKDLSRVDDAGGHANNLETAAAAINEKQDAQMAYNQRSAKVAMLLLELLILGVEEIDSDDDSSETELPQPNLESLKLENFTLEIDLGGTSSATSLDSALVSALKAGDERSFEELISSIKNRDRSDDEQLQVETIYSVIESVGSVDFVVSKENSSFQRMSSQLKSYPVCHCIGLILYEIFSRGVKFQRSDENAGSSPQSKTEGDEQEENGEYVPSEKARRRSSTENSVCTFFKTMGISDKINEQVLLDNGVPTSIRRFVMDLILSDASSFHSSFESLEDVLSELNQMIKRPDIFFRDFHFDRNIDQSEIHLDFGQELIGRSDQVHRLIHEAQSIRSARRNGSISNSVVFVSGLSGSGKSSLVQVAKEKLALTGWSFMSSKFDLMGRSQPLQTIALAFEKFFAPIAATVREEDNELGAEAENANAMISSIERVLSAPSIVVLSKLVPSFRVLFPGIFRRVISDPDLESLCEREQGQEVEQQAEQMDLGGAETSLNRLKYLLQQLLHSISSPDNPILFFLDDLHWADSGSLGLLSNLIMDFGNLQQVAGGNNMSCILFVVSYRSDEVDNMHEVANYRDMFEFAETVNVTNIHLDGFSRGETNTMLSEALMLPPRLTRPLADVVEGKTLGNPFHVKTFVNSLVEEKVIWYSLVEKRYLWDLEVVRTKSMDENLAELLGRNLFELPALVQGVLRVMACFGSNVDEKILQLLYSSLQFQGLIDNLDRAIDENIIEKRGQTYMFQHDLLLQAAYDLMTPDERGQFHFSIGNQIIIASSAEREVQANDVVFVAIDQINKAKACGVTDHSLSIVFATLNLKAGEQALKVSDFETAFSYIEFGISFLPVGHWVSNYALSVRMFQTACLISHVRGLTEKLSTFLAELIGNAKCLDDKLQGYYVMIRSLTASAKPIEALEMGLSILNELGEDFPSDATQALLRTELLSTKSLLDGLSKDDIVSAPRLSNAKIQWVLKFLNLLAPPAYVARPSLFPLVRLRMVKLSVEHGYCSESALGLFGYSIALLSILNNADEAYRWGKIALALLDSLNSKELYPELKSLFHISVSIFAEPLQAVSSDLKLAHQEAMAIGEIDFAMLSGSNYCLQSVLSGDNLQLVERECAALSLKMAQTKQMHHIYAHCSRHLTILNFLGKEKNPFDVLHGKFDCEEDILKYTIATGKSALAQLIHFEKLVRAVYFKNFEEAAEMAKLYKQRPIMHFSNVFCVFYEGLTAFHFARTLTEDPIWMEMGESAMKTLQEWANKSTWNFENKQLALEAEWHFSRKEYDQAIDKYEASIESARRHRFVNEEGLAHELLGECYMENMEVEKATEQATSACMCYDKWGAFGLVNFLNSRE